MITKITFSQEPPSAPGLYWYRLVEDSAIHYTRVWEHEIHTEEFLDGKWGKNKVLVVSIGSGFKPVTQFGRWWSNEFLPDAK